MKIDTLQIYYDGFINQQNQGEFLRGMADYVELAINDEDCKRFILGIQSLKDSFILENKDSDILASKKTRLIKGDYKDIFSNKEKTGDLTLDDGSSFEIKNQQTSEIEKKIKDGQGTTVWESWDKMCLAYLCIFKSYKVLTDVNQRDEYDSFILANNDELVERIEQLEPYSKNQVDIVLSCPEIIANENYRLYVAKVHGYFVEKLDSEQSPKKEDVLNSDSTALEKKSNNNGFNFPNDLRWEEIEIRFTGSDDVVIITRGKHTPTNFELMGFQDNKTKKPDLQWKFLQLLAIKGGEISWENNHDLEKKVFDTIKAKKATTKKRLQYIFGISSDPFYPYKKEKAYRLKLKLTPEPNISMATNDESMKDDWRDVYNDAVTPKFKYNETDDD